MKTIKELRDYLLDNYVDGDGDLYINGLDFSNFDGDVYITGMKVQGNLYQDSQNVQGDLYQNYQTAQGDLAQNSQEVQGNLYHGYSKYGGELIERPYSKLLKEVTAEELEELGYKLKEENK